MTSKPRFWIQQHPYPGGSAAAAEQAEAEGWDGLSFGDSQHRYGDPYVALALAARASARLDLQVLVTNDIVRNIAATASAIATVQVESGGRAVLGIGRGDSAVSDAGLAPSTVESFEKSLRDLQAYLRGDEVLTPLGWSRLVWVSPDTAKVPVAVAPSGPRMTAVAARHADRVTFAVGSDPQRLARSVALARQLRRDAGLDPDGIAYGAIVSAVPHHDVGVARDLARDRVGTLAHFAHRVDALRDARRIEGPPVTDDVVDAVAAVGPPEQVIERLSALLSLGLDHLVFANYSRSAAQRDVLTARHLMAREVLPALRERFG
jgi:5,10-methylenetetrahydromethanopterin reductase